ncbi:TRAP transporter small permease [Roseovarius sp.]|uniref:TRAP transporter small permease n=1 Tax=Roseovarius sp. TaxID=1486281 RepID=UPI003561CB9B
MGLKALPAIAEAIARGAVLVAGIALAIILLLIGAQIGSRVFTGDSLSWSDELARLFFIYLVFIGATEASMRRNHIAVDLRDTFGLSDSVDRVLDLVRMVLCVAVLAVIAVGAWKIIPVVENMQRPATRLSTTWMYYPIFVGSLLMIVATAINFFSCLTGGSIYRDNAKNQHDLLE